MVRQRSHCSNSENTRVWYNKDVEGVGCSLFIELSLLFSFTVLEILFIPTTSGNVITLLTLRVCSALLYIICVICHCLCIFTDPGAVPHNAHPLQENVEEGSRLLIRCGICDSFKPPKSHHCSTCKRCVLRLDHHCPWINNCVGMLNMKYFILFLTYSSLYCILLFICTIIAEIHGYNGSEDYQIILHFLSIAACLFLSIIFGFFSTIILSDTVVSIFNGQTKIDRMKDIVVQKQTISENFAEFFGGNGQFRFDWLIPTKPRYVNFDMVSGYVKDPLGMSWNGYDQSNTSINSNS